MSWEWGEGFGWLRLGPWVFSWRDHGLHPPLFSERQGMRSCLHLGRWGFQLDCPRGPGLL